MDSILTILAGIGGAIIAGLFTLLGTIMGARSARRQMELQHQLQQREHFRLQREALYLDILAWVNRVNMELIALPQTRDFSRFLSAVKDTSLDFEKLLPRLQLLSSPSVVDIFRGMNDGLHRLLDVLQPEGMTGHDVMGDKIVEAFSGALREFMNQGEVLINQMKADLNIGEGETK